MVVSLSRQSCKCRSEGGGTAGVDSFQQPDSPVLTEQTMVPSVVDVTYGPSVPITHQTRPSVPDEQVVLKSDVPLAPFADHMTHSHIDRRTSKAGKMGKRKDVSEFDEGQILMARRLDQGISKTAALLGVFPVYSGAATAVFYSKDSTSYLPNTFGPGSLTEILKPL
ncbi:hypothetical protein QTP70_004234 [Hemibagrus guttatus]|uniref:Uncharacterized protein n=1 Tax=Hemibagrus guttatus TaxID=175788 RepID=A0AAE0UJ20_9TELE|nr:hypothetical protein QTP70_004234 [Hemibagrus guttatus]